MLSILGYPVPPLGDQEVPSSILCPAARMLQSLLRLAHYIPVMRHRGHMDDFQWRGATMTGDVPFAAYVRALRGTRWGVVELLYGIHERRSVSDPMVVLARDVLASLETERLLSMISVDRPGSYATLEIHADGPDLVVGYTLSAAAGRPMSRQAGTDFLLYCDAYIPRAISRSWTVTYHLEERAPLGRRSSGGRADTHACRRTSP